MKSRVINITRAYFFVLCNSLILLGIKTYVRNVLGKSIYIFIDKV